MPGLDGTGVPSGDAVQRAQAEAEAADSHDVDTVLGDLTFRGLVGNMNCDNGDLVARFDQRLRFLGDASVILE